MSWEILKEGRGVQFLNLPSRNIILEPEIPFKKNIQSAMGGLLGHIKGYYI